MKVTEERQRAWRRLEWLNSRAGGRYNQAELSELIGTTQGGVSNYLARGIKQIAVCRWIGCLFIDRCQALGLDPYAVDATLTPPDPSLAA